MTGYILHRAADEDLVCGARYIRRDNPDAAVQFLERAFEAFDFIAGWPEASPTARLSARRHRGIRFRPLPRPFQSYLVFYQIKPDAVHIYRVLHGATNWQEDLRLFG
jgi:plasmid stabilization system protein ParE